jgi:hypothetical protein
VLAPPGPLQPHRRHHTAIIHTVMMDNNEDENYEEELTTTKHAINNFTQRISRVDYDRSAKRKAQLDRNRRRSAPANMRDTFTGSFRL